MPDWVTAATTCTDPWGPTDAAGTLRWNVDVNSTGYYVWNGTSAAVNNGIIASLPEQIGVQNIEPEVKRKHFIAPEHELRFLPDAERRFKDVVALFDPEQPYPDKVVELKPDVLKPIKRLDGNRHVYEVYEVAEKPWHASEQYFSEALESRGLKKTAHGFYIQDDEVKFGFRRRKIVELRQPPAFISRYRLSDTKVTSQEMKARELLRRYVGEKEFKRYRQLGYIVMWAHGFMWRVPGERATIHHVEQFLKGKCIATYCVHFADDKIPPTDACVMRMALIHAGIDVLKKHSNVYDKTIVLDLANSVLTFEDVKKEVPLQLSFVDAAKKVKEMYSI